MKLHLPLPLRAALCCLFVVHMAAATEYTLQQASELPETITTDVADTYILGADITFNDVPRSFSDGADITITSPQGMPHALTFEGLYNDTTHGGAIWLVDAKLSMLHNGDIAFTNNQAHQSGGAVALLSHSEQSIQGNGNLIFADNRAYAGGAIYASQSTQRLENNGHITISGNRAYSFSGGAICLENGSTQIIRHNGNIIISDNTSSWGGAISLSQSTQLIQNNADVTFSGNYGHYGGAIALQNNASQTISGNASVTFTANLSSDGAAMHVSESTQAISNNGNVTFSGNSGGGITLNESTQTIDGNSDVSFIANRGVFPSTVHLSASSQTISGNGNILFSLNTSPRSGGAVSLYNGSTQNIRNNNDITFADNTADTYGGAVYVENSLLNITGNGEILFRGNSCMSLDPEKPYSTDLTYRLNAIFGTVPLKPNEQPNTMLVLSSPTDRTIAFHDPIVLAAVDATGRTTTDAVLLHLNGEPTTDGIRTTGQGAIIITAETAESDLRGVFERLNKPLPDAARWEELLEESRTTVIDGAAILHAGSFVLKDNASYRGLVFTAMPDSELHLRNGAAMQLAQAAILSDGSRITVSGSAPSRLSAASITADNVAFHLHLTETSVSTRFPQAVTHTPRLILAATDGTVSLNGSSFIVAPEAGVRRLPDGSYVLLQLEKPAVSHLLNKYSYSLEGMTANESSFTWNSDGTELIWTAKGIVILPPPPALPEAAILAGAVSINTLWSATHSLQDFSNSLRTHSVQRTFGNEGRGAVWFDTLGSFRNQQGEGGFPGYDFTSWGAALGTEYTIEPHLIVGGGIGSLFGKNKADGGFSSVDQNMIMGGLYANMRLMDRKNDSLWLKASVSYGHADNDGHISSRDGMDRINGNWNATSWTGDMRTVWTHSLDDRTRLYTFAGLRYTAAQQGDFSATGAQSGTYLLHGAELSTLQLPVGMGIGYDTGAWGFYGDASVLPDVGRKNPRTQIADAEGNTYTADGANPGRCSFEMNATASYMLNAQWRLHAGYRLETTGYNTQQSASIGTSYSF